MTTERTPQDVLREAILAVPMGTFPKPGLASVAGWNRYDTDDEHVLHIWSSDQSHQGESWDFRAPKADKAIAEAPDSPESGLSATDYWLTFLVAHAEHVHGCEHTGQLRDALELATAAPDTLSEKPGLAPELAAQELARVYDGLRQWLYAWTDVDGAQFLDGAMASIHNAVEELRDFDAASEKKP